MDLYYVYQHTRLDENLVFYVGKGKNNRHSEKNNRNRYWHNVVNKAGFTSQILYGNLDEELSLLIEMELIDKYKKLGIKLVNITSGGEGVSGLKHSSDAKKKMSEKAKGKIITNDTRTKLSKALIGIKRKPFTDEHKAKLSEASKKQKHIITEETKTKISKSNLGKKRTPEQKLKISEATKLAYQKRMGLNNG